MIVSLVLAAAWALSAGTAEAQLHWRANYASSMPVYRGPGRAEADVDARPAAMNASESAGPRSSRVPINPLLLRQDPASIYRLGPGDVLGVFIDGVLGQRDGQIPVHFPEDGRNDPSMGFPVPVRDSGMISLPLVRDIPVTGLSIAEAEEAIRRVYVDEERILQPRRDRIVVSLMQKRMVRVLVIREDMGAAGPQLGYAIKRGNGSTISLPAGKNDVLHALVETGGLPGLDAKNEVTIYHGPRRNTPSPPAGEGRGEGADDRLTIPLRVDPSMHRPNHTQRDITLHDGDVVYIEARDRDVYYTGGVLGGAEVLLPRDRDLTVMQALAAAGGLTHRPGEFFPATRAIVLRGGLPLSFSTRRALTRGSPYVQPGDLLLLDYTPSARMGNWLNSQVNLQWLLNSF